MVTVGTVVWLASDLMFFAGLFAAYFTIRSVAPDLWVLETAKLNIPFATINTIILVLSSVTCQMGVFAAERGKAGRSASLLKFSQWGMREWFVLSYIMGAIFIAGQATEYAALVIEGTSISSSPYGSMFYLATGRIPRPPRARRPPGVPAHHRPDVPGAPVHSRTGHLRDRRLLLLALRRHRVGWPVRHHLHDPLTPDDNRSIV
jgi:hypothetical protein